MKKLLFNPFEKYDGWPLLAFGLTLTILGSLAGAYFNARFDGILDMHTVPYTFWYQPLLDSAVNAVTLTLLLYALAYFINNKTRFIDIINPVLIARLPFYILPLFTAGGYMDNATAQIMAATANPESPDLSGISATSLFIILLFSLIAVAFLVWFVVLLYNGFKIAANAKTTQHKIAFAGVILFAEIFSKIIIGLCNY